MSLRVGSRRCSAHGSPMPRAQRRAWSSPMISSSSTLRCAKRSIRFDVLVLGVATGDRLVADAVRRIREVRPQLPVVVYLGVAANQSSTIPAITHAGIDELVVPGYNDDRVHLREALTAARRSCAVRWVLGKLATVVPARLLRFAESAIADPQRVQSVPLLAERAGVDRKTLYNWCRMSRFFKPGDLLTLCRLALAAYYLGTTRCSIDLIARDLGYPSDTALRNTIKRKTGLTATELRDQGGLDAFIRIFAAKLSSERSSKNRTPT